MRRSVAVLASIAGAAGVAHAAEGDVKVRVEQVRCFAGGEPVEPPCDRDDPMVVADSNVFLTQECDGEDVRVKLLRRSQSLGVRFKRVDLGPGATNAVFADGRSGASARGGDATIVVPRGGALCGRPKVLLRSPGTHRTPKPAGATSSSDAFVEVKGRVVTLSQTWYRDGDAGCCPTWEATARYQLRDGRLVRTASSIRRLPRG